MRFVQIHNIYIYYILHIEYIHIIYSLYIYYNMYYALIEMVQAYPNWSIWGGVPRQKPGKFSRVDIQHKDFGFHFAGSGIFWVRIFQESYVVMVKDGKSFGKLEI